MGGRRWEWAPRTRVRGTVHRGCLRRGYREGGLRYASLDVTERVTARLQHGRHNRLPQIRTVHWRVPVQAPELLQLRFHLLGRHHLTKRREIGRASCRERG